MSDSSPSLDVVQLIEIEIIHVGFHVMMVVVRAAVVIMRAVAIMRTMGAVLVTVMLKLDDPDDVVVVVAAVVGVLVAVRPTVRTVRTEVRAAVGTMLPVRTLDLDLDFVLLGFLPLGTDTARRSLGRGAGKIYLDRDSLLIGTLRALRVLRVLRCLGRRYR